MVESAANPRSDLGVPERLSYCDPPMFDWPGDSGLERETLEFSTDPAFGEGATESVTVDRCFYTPRRSFGVPRVYYRHRVGDGWSAVRAIRFHGEVHRWIAPEVPHEAIGAMARPRFRALFVAHAGEPGEGQLARMRRRARVERDRGVPEDPPLFDAKRWRHRVDWLTEIAWPVTAVTGFRLAAMARRAALTGDGEIARCAVDMLMQAAAWDPEGASRMKENDLHSGFLARGMAFCYDAAYHVLTEEQRASVRENLAIRAREYYEHLHPLTCNASQNHTWNHATIVGVVALALDGDLREAREWLDCMTELYAYRFFPSMGFQGDNQEGLTYWVYGTGILSRFCEPMRHVAGVNLYEHPWMAQTGRFGVVCAPPDGYAVPLGDLGGPLNHYWKGRLGHRAITHHLPATIGTAAKDPVAMWYGGAEEVGDLPEPIPPVEIPQSVLYRHIGWAVFNTDLVNGRENVCVGMRSGTYYAGHQHADNNHFFINAYGDKLAVDGGVYDWYGSPHFLGYSVRTIAHNTILVNGEGQAWREAGSDGRIADWHDSPGYGYTVGDASAPGVYGGALERFDRRLLFVKPGFLIVHDLLDTGGEAARFDWLLHSHGDAPVVEGDGFRISRPRASLEGRVLAPGDVALSAEEAFDRRDILKPKSTTPIDHPEALDQEWIVRAVPGEKRAREEFVCAMRIGRRDALAGPDAAISGEEMANGFVVRIACGDARHVVLLRKAGDVGAMASDGVETDGEVAAVELDAAGKVVRAFLAQGTRLASGGEVLHASDETGDWSMSGLPEPPVREIEPVWIDVDGERREDVRVWERAQPGVEQRTYFASLDATDRRWLRVELCGWSGDVAPILLHNGNPTAPEEGEGLVYRLKVWPRRHYLTVSGPGALAGIEVRADV